MNLKRTASIFAFTFICSIVAFGQESRCSLNLAQLPQAPELRGFRLGMTIEQVKSRIPQVQLPPSNEFGFTQTTVNPEFSAEIDRSTLQGVRTLSFDFLDGRSFSLALGYNSSFEWQSMDEFLPGITKALNLPNAWEAKSWRGQELECKDFKITARMIGGSPSIFITDTSTKRVLENRIAQKEEEKN